MLGDHIVVAPVLEKGQRCRDVNNVKTLALLELRMLTLLSLTIGQRALLTEAVMALKSKRSHIYTFVCKFYD